MDKRLRLRILNKLAQTAPANPANPPATIPKALTAVPGEWYSTLNNGYSPDTANAIRAITETLNIAYNAASGDASYKQLKESGFALSGVDPDQKHIGNLCQMFFKTFLNNGGSFPPGQKKSATDINNWVNAFIGSNDYLSLTQVKATSTLGAKVGNLRTTLQNQMDLIKRMNPITA